MISVLLSFNTVMWFNTMIKTVSLTAFIVCTYVCSCITFLVHLLSFTVHYCAVFFFCFLFIFFLLKNLYMWHSLFCSPIMAKFVQASYLTMFCAIFTLRGVNSCFQRLILNVFAAFLYLKASTLPGIITFSLN